MKHRYPRRLIPKHSFSLIGEDFIRARMKKFFLIRKIAKDNTRLDIMDRLKSQFNPSTFKNGISVVLFSSLQEDDLGWSCRKPFGSLRLYEKKWEDNNRRSIVPKNKHLRYVKNSEYCGYLIQDIYDYDTEFITTIRNKNGKALKDKNGEDVNRTDHIRLRVIHEPVCINYWHCEVFLYRVNGSTQLVEDLSNKEIERAGNLILDDLVDMAKLAEETNMRHLPKKFYRALS